MKHERLPDKFTRIGLDDEGREYIQCTRTGDVLVQTAQSGWSHFATIDQWRSRTAAQLYPELIYLKRTLKRVGTQEDVEDQLQLLREARVLLDGLGKNIDERIRRFENYAKSADGAALV
ncbi:MAG TPA: hypothetical protein VFI91_00865 [Longimicrobiaceae bacterium]|nr:hypothetical protein [Longimicrobiaceae bacterium]